MKVQVIGGPDDVRRIDADPGVKTIEVHVGGLRYAVPVRSRKAYWNERKQIR